MSFAALESAIANVPAGAWGVGVSGGADSVALLMLLRERSDISPVVVHLDHQMRGDESTADAEFVVHLAAQLSLPCVLERRDALERTSSDLPRNPSARYRRLRLALFERVAKERQLQGVLLAHHADDQAETVLQRLLRGSPPAGLVGMGLHARLGELLVMRPLLGVQRQLLRAYLESLVQPWREDASNVSEAYLRNRLRMLLRNDPPLTESLLQLATACAVLQDWLERTAVELPPEFHVDDLACMPRILANVSARRWLLARGVRPDQIEPAMMNRLLAMAQDAASPPRQQFPTGLMVRRHRSVIAKVPGTF